MRNIFLLAGVGAFLGLGAPRVEAENIRDRDAATQREVATKRPAEGSASGAQPSRNAAKPEAPGYGLLPGFVQPYGYPVSPYADIYTGR